MSSPNRNATTPLADVISAAASMGAPRDGQELDAVAGVALEAQVRFILWLLATPRVVQSFRSSLNVEELVRQEVDRRMAAHRCPPPQPAVRRIYQTLTGL